MESFSDKPLYALEEQLARQKAILENRMLVQRLPDKGAKVKANLEKIEAEIQKRRKETIAKQGMMMSPLDIEKMEWSLSNGSSSPKKAPVVLDSDDDEEEENPEDSSLHPNPLKIIAESQISQRQPKKIVLLEKSSNSPSSSSSDLDRFTSRLVKTDSKKSEDAKFMPSKSVKLNKKASPNPPLPDDGNSSPARSSESSTSSTKLEGVPKWAEALLPPTHSFETSKLLSMEETIKVEKEKIKQFEERMATQPQKEKVYAYDRLKSKGLLGQFTVEMQVSRPVRTDAEDDAFDENEDDLTDDDQITEEEEDEEGDEEEISKDLSKLVNSSLQLK